MPIPKSLHHTIFHALYTAGKSHHHSPQSAAHAQRPKPQESAQHDPVHGALGWSGNAVDTKYKIDKYIQTTAEVKPVD
jgi:hypothetical protein